MNPAFACLSVKPVLSFRLLGRWGSVVWAQAIQAASVPSPSLLVCSCVGFVGVLFILFAMLMQVNHYILYIVLQTWCSHLPWPYEPGS